MFSQFSHLLQNIKSVVFPPINLSTSHSLVVYMQASLLFVLAIVTFGVCKKSHKAKHEGYLIHKKGHKKGKTYLKINKSTGKSKPHYWTAHKGQPKGQGDDYRDIDDNKWIEEEKIWMDKWDRVWNNIYSDADRKKLKPKHEAGGLELTEWEIFLEALDNRTEARIEEERMKNETRNFLRFFINPKHRRNRLKWVQTTKETEKVFLAHTFTNNLQESIHNMREKVRLKGLKKEKKPCEALYSCSWTALPNPKQASTTTAGTTMTFVPAFAPKITLTTTTTFVGTKPPEATVKPDPYRLWQPLIKDKTERDLLNNFLSKELEPLAWSSPSPSPGDYDVLSAAHNHRCNLNRR